MIESPADGLPIGKNRVETIDFRQQFGIADRLDDGVNGMQRDDRRKPFLRRPRDDFDNLIVIGGGDAHAEQVVLGGPSDLRGRSAGGKFAVVVEQSMLS